MTPDHIENFVSGNHGIFALSQQFKNHDFAFVQTFGATILQLGRPGAKVHAVTSEREDKSSLEFGVDPTCAAQHVRDAQHKFGQVKGLDHVIVAAYLESLHAVFGLTFGTSQQNGRLISSLAHLPANLKPV